jgi:hypothetical protein
VPSRSRSIRQAAVTCSIPGFPGEIFDLELDVRRGPAVQRVSHQALTPGGTGEEG